MDNSKKQIVEGGAISLSDERWREARRRAEIIEPLAIQTVVTLRAAVGAAKELGLSKSTVYELVGKWRSSGGSIPSLVPAPPTGGRGKSRLPQATDAIIKEAIDRHYLSRQKPSISAVMREIRRNCRLQGYKPPAFNTVKLRIEQLCPSKTTKRREGVDASRRLTTAGGTTPTADNVLDIVQIDHTKIDVIIVEPNSRQPICRPYLTIAIDVFSRSILGMCVTLEAPSATSVGLCLAHCATDKHAWLERLGLDCEWPMQGKPKSIHVDNGADFHSEALRRGCEVHGIKINFRPPGQPHFGGIVERVIGTAMGFVHELPGTTFSNIRDRRQYDSEAKAVLTLVELEKWLALAIAGPYHNDVHSGIMEPPASKWNNAIAATGAIPTVSNSRAFVIDFLPIVRRQIQRAGFVIDRIGYFSSALSKWIGDRDRLEKFVIRRDPRDLSRIWVLDPEQKAYHEVPYRTLSNPPVTLWEHRKALQLLRERGRSEIDEQAIFRAIAQMRSITDEAIKKSKAARRSKARTVHLDKRPRKFEPPSLEKEPTTDAGVVRPFNEIEEW